VECASDAEGPEQRAELRDWLIDQGATAGQIEAAIVEGRLEGVASDLVLTREATLSVGEVAARAGVPVADVVSMFHDLGVTIDDGDAAQFTEQDAVLVSRLCLASGAHGIMRGPDLLRVVASALERIAEAAVAVYVQGPELELRHRWASSLEHARKDVHATELALELGVGLGPVFRHHMRQAIARQRIIQEGVTRREMARLAIGFVDLVGSTTMQSGLDPDELGALISRFEATAFDVTAAGGGRLVKFIGDEIMVAALDPVAGCRIVGDLIAAFTDDGTQPRGGLVFGEVLFRHGDYYGPVVNMAARLVDAAIPGEALVDGSVVEATKDETLVFEPAGRRMLKGFEAPVAVWSLLAEA
jgi:adenylate cyclase